MDADLLYRDFNSIPRSCFEFLRNKTLFVTGGSGLIGSFLVCSVLSDLSFPICIKLLVLNSEKEKARFYKYGDDPRLIFIEGDVREPIDNADADYYLHMASMTDPMQYSRFPVETIEINVLGLKNVLDCAAKRQNSKVLVFSSCEIYGDLTKEEYKEDDLGYLDLSNPRSCYNESKRLCEVMCSCYKKEHGCDYSIVRLSRVYGPTMRLDDEKALAQFLRKGIAHQDIVLKSAGKQLFDYLYVSDAVKGILLLLNKGGPEAYNLAKKPEMNLASVAKLIATLAGTNVVFDVPSDQEREGYSLAKQSVLNTDKIFALGFVPEVSIEEGIRRILAIHSK